jgi:hypothetical protein
VSQFVSLEREWLAIFDPAWKAEAAVRADPRTACFWARRGDEHASGIRVGYATRQRSSGCVPRCAPAR